MSIQPSVPPAKTTRRAYEKPRIEVVSLVSDETVLGDNACQNYSNDSLNPLECKTSLSYCLHPSS